ncbi:MAG: hypothetical protein IKU34_12195 [Clostridia bacterium]|nr:hypothetical protein [Clostridia bacterium]
MSEAVLSAIITAVLALVGTVITVVTTNRQTLAALDKKSELSDAKLEAELEKHMAVTDTKIEELTREVRAHNEFARRVPVLEEKVAHLEKGAKA